jgi:hypothetical protein
VLGGVCEIVLGGVCEIVLGVDGAKYDISSRGGDLGTGGGGGEGSGGDGGGLGGGDGSGGCGHGGGGILPEAIDINSRYFSIYLLKIL